MIIVVVFTISPNEIFSKVKKFTIKANKEEVGEVLKEIENKTGILIIYSDLVKGEIDLILKNISAKKALDKLCKKIGAKYVPLPLPYLRAKKKKEGYYIGIVNPEAYYKAVYNKKNYKKWEELSEKDKKHAEYLCLRNEFNKKYYWASMRSSSRQDKERAKVIKGRQKKRLEETKKDMITNYNAKFDWDIEDAKNKIKPLGIPKGKLGFIEKIKKEYKAELEKKIYFKKSSKIKARLSNDKKEIKFYDKNGKIMNQEKINKGIITVSDNGEYYGVNPYNKKYYYKDKFGKIMFKLDNLWVGTRSKYDDTICSTPMLIKPDGEIVILWAGGVEGTGGLTIFNKNGEIITNFKGVEIGDKDYYFSKGGKYFYIDLNTEIYLFSKYGKVLWKKKFGPVSIYPLVSEDFNYFYLLIQNWETYRKDILCLDLKGDIIWRRNFKGGVAANQIVLCNNDKNLFIWEYIHIRDKNGKRKEIIIYNIDSYNGNIMWSRNMSKEYIDNKLDGGFERIWFKVFYVKEYFIVLCSLKDKQKNKYYFMWVFTGKGKYIDKSKFDFDETNKIINFKINNNFLFIMQEKNILKYRIKD